MEDKESNNTTKSNIMENQNEKEQVVKEELETKNEQIVSEIKKEEENQNEEESEEESGNFLENMVKTELFSTITTFINQLELLFDYIDKKNIKKYKSIF